MVSKESECVYPMHKDSTAPPKFLMQEYLNLNLVDWKEIELSSTQRRCKASVKKFERSPTVLAECITHGFLARVPLTFGQPSAQAPPGEVLDMGAAAISNRMKMRHLAAADHMTAA